MSEDTAQHMTPEDLIETMGLTEGVINTLRTEYGLAVTVTGDPDQPYELAEVKDRKFGPAIREAAEEGKDKGAKVAKAISRGAGKVGQAVVYGTLVAPAEGASTVKDKLSNVRARARQRHAANKLSRQRAKEAKKAAREQEAAAETQ